MGKGWRHHGVGKRNITKQLEQINRAERHRHHQLTSRKFHDKMQRDSVYVKHWQIYTGCRLWLADGENNPGSGHLVERAGTEDSPLSFPSEAPSGHRTRAAGLQTVPTADSSKIEVSWPVSRINYLLLCYSVAKKHTKQHILKQHTSGKSALGRNTGSQWHACNRLAQWLSRWGSWAGSIKVTWELDKKCKFPGPAPDPLNSALWGWGPAIGIFPGPEGDSDTHSRGEPRG